MTFSVPTSGLSTEELAKIAGFDLSVAEALDAAFTNSLVDSPYVDLRQSPYNVRAGSTTLAVRQANTSGIKAAIAAYSGTRARLVLPVGTIYVEEDTAQWCIKFGTGVSDITLTGQGMYASRLAMYAVSDGGDLHLLVLDGCQRIEICNLGLELNTITNIEVSQQNHMLCVFNNTLGGTTRDINCHHLFFGKCNGDAFRILADDPGDKVQNVSLSHFVMQLQGTVTSTPPNSRVGARCGIAIQRGGEDITISNGYIRGAQNSCVDEEPSGGSSRRVRYLNLIIDNSQGVTDNAVSLGGSGGGDLVYDHRMIDCYISGGCISMLGGTSGFKMIRTTVEQTAASPSDPTTPLLYVRSQAAAHTDLEFVDCTFKRSGTSGNGKLIDVINSGNRTTFRGLHCVQGKTEDPIWIEASGLVEVSNYTLQYDGGSAASRSGVVVQPLAGGATISQVRINGMTVVSSGGKIGKAVFLASRASRVISKVVVRDVQADGYASIGVCWEATAGTFDLTPDIRGVDVGTDTPWEQRDGASAPTTAHFVIAGGNRNDVCQYIGDAAPGGVLAAKQGSTCVYRNGDSTALYFKSTGTGSAGWTAVSIP